MAFYTRQRQLTRKVRMSFHFKFWRIYDKLLKKQKQKKDRISESEPVTLSQITEMPVKQ